VFFIGVLIVLSFIIGYYTYNLLNPSEVPKPIQQNCSVNNSIVSASEINSFGSSFTKYMSAILKINNAPSNIVYYGYQRDGPHIILFYKENTGYMFNATFSSDLKYMYPNVLSVDETRSYVDNLIAQQKSKRPEVVLFLDACNQSQILVNQVLELYNHTNVSVISLAYTVYSPEQLNLSEEEIDALCLSDSNKTFCSLYGKSYLERAGREMAVFSLYGGDQWLKFKSDMEACSWSCYDSEPGISPDDVDAMLFRQLDLSQRYTSQINFKTPAIFINGMPYDGARTAEAYREEICSTYLEQPEWCQDQLSTYGVSFCS